MTCRSLQWFAGHSCDLQTRRVDIGGSGSRKGQITKNLIYFFLVIYLRYDLQNFFVMSWDQTTYVGIFLFCLRVVQSWFLNFGWILSDPVRITKNFLQSQPCYSQETLCLTAEAFNRINSAIDQSWNTLLLQPFQTQCENYDTFEWQKPCRTKLVGAMGRVSLFERQTCIQFGTSTGLMHGLCLKSSHFTFQSRICWQIMITVVSCCIWYSMDAMNTAIFHGWHAPPSF